jgi:hypothetical protein
LNLKLETVTPAITPVIIAAGLRVPGPGDPAVSAAGELRVGAAASHGARAWRPGPSHWQTVGVTVQRAATPRFTVRPRLSLPGWPGAAPLARPGRRLLGPAESAGSESSDSAGPRAAGPPSLRLGEHGYYLQWPRAAPGTESLT